MSSAWTIASGKTVNLCLNGHGIRNPIKVEGELNLYDCDTETTHKYTVDRYGTATVNDTLESGYQTFKGGYIMGKNIYGAVINEGTLKMKGGTIIGCQSMAVHNKGSFIMSNGSIMGNGGGAVTNDSTFSMEGGTISNNVGIYGAVGVSRDATFTMTGGEIKNNTGLGGVAINTGATFKTV